MYRFQRATLGLLLGLIPAACTKEKATSGCAIGDEGCACYPNETCNGKELVCLSKLCVNPNDPGTGGTKNDGEGNDTEAADAGETAGSVDGKGNTPGSTAKPNATFGPPVANSSLNPGSSSKPAGTGASTAPSGTPVLAHGKLSISGRQLVNQSGQAVQLRGVSTMWLNWDDAGYSQDLEGLRFMRDSWKLQLLRVAMGVDAEKAYLTDPEKMKQMLYRAVDNAIQLGIYVIVDWHDHEAHLHTEEAKAFFDEVSAKYRGVPNVLYETFNEPLKVSWSSTVKPYHEAVVAVIRKNDPDAVIILGSPNWDQDVDVATADPVAGKNLMYSVHFYSCTHGSRELAKAKQAFSQNAALFVTEWGASDADGGKDGIVCDSEAQTWLSWLDSSKISWAAWKLDSCTATLCDSTAFFKSRSVSPSGGWTTADLNGHAPFVVSKLKEAPALPLPIPSSGPVSTSTPATTIPPASTTTPVSSCTPTGSCAAGNGQDCKDGALVVRDCTGCALLSCGTACCGGLGALGGVTYPDFVERPSIVQSFTANASSASLGLQFTGADQMGAITFALDKAYSFDPYELDVLLTATGSVSGDVTISLENGASGCLYYTYPLTGGGLQLYTESVCWGGWVKGELTRPVKQVNVRVDSLSSGTATLSVISVKIPL